MVSCAFAATLRSASREGARSEFHLPSWLEDPGAGENRTQIAGRAWLAFAMGFGLRAVLADS